MMVSQDIMNIINRWNMSNAFNDDLKAVHNFISAKKLTKTLMAFAKL